MSEVLRYRNSEHRMSVLDITLREGIVLLLITLKHSKAIMHNKLNIYIAIGNI